MTPWPLSEGWFIASRAFGSQTDPRGYGLYLLGASGTQERETPVRTDVFIRFPRVDKSGTSPIPRCRPRMRECSRRSSASPTRPRRAQRVSALT